MPKLGATGLDVFPLCLGGNVFGWTADQSESFAILDRYADAGGNFIDTANQYSFWAPGNSGGESETILGRWMTERGNRGQIVLASKVGGEMPGLPHDLRADTIRRSARESLERLQTDRIDLFYAHFDDKSTPLQETMGAFTELVRDGEVLHLGASNYTAARLAEMMEVVERDDLEPVRVLEPPYNLVQREFERELQPLCEKYGLATVPYFGLAQGFLTGKYRDRNANGGSPRAEEAIAFLDDRGERVLAALDEISAAHRTSPAAIALAWLSTRATVAAPIASASHASQVDDLLAVATIELTPDELRALDEAGAS